MLKTVNHSSGKYNQFYQDMADLVAKQSVAERRKVGAVIVLPSGMLAIGWNGTPSGFNNDCEYDSDTLPLKTRPEVIHAERNALDKLTRQGVSTEGAVLFVTTAPCIECAKSVAAVGITEVHYRDIQSNTKGLEFLKEAKVPTYQYREN